MTSQYVGSVELGLKASQNKEFLILLDFILGMSHNTIEIVTLFLSPRLRSVSPAEMELKTATNIHPNSTQPKKKKRKFKVSLECGVKTYTIVS